jgi:hypothetical protein
MLEDLSKFLHEIAGVPLYLDQQQEESAPVPYGVESLHHVCCNLTNTRIARLILAIYMQPFLYEDDEGNECWAVPPLHYDFERRAIAEDRDYLLYLPNVHNGTIDRVQLMILDDRVNRGVLNDYPGQIEWNDLRDNIDDMMRRKFADYMNEWFIYGEGSPFLNYANTYLPEYVETDPNDWMVAQQEDYLIEVPYKILEMKCFAGTLHNRTRILHLTPGSRISFYIQFAGEALNPDQSRFLGRRPKKATIEQGFIIPHPDDCPICATPKELVSFDKETAAIYAKHREELLGELKL